MGPLTLCYHAVSDSWDHPFAVPSDALRAQLAWVARRGYAWGSLTAVARHEPVAHVTFDDAYASVLAALPILRSAAATATVFVATDFVGETFTTSLLSTEPSLERAVLTWDDLRQLAHEKIGIGSHSVTHRELTGLSDGELKMELRDSREAIEDYLGRRCTALAYPYGCFDGRVRLAARRAGYRYAFALSDGSGSLGDLPRTVVFRKDVGARFALKTSGFGRQVSRLRRSRAAKST